MKFLINISLSIGHLQDNLVVGPSNTTDLIQPLLLAMSIKTLMNSEKNFNFKFQNIVLFAFRMN